MHAIRAALTATGKILLFRNNCGFDADRKVRYGLGVGSADLVGLLSSGPHRGAFVGFEIKTPTGRIQKEQILWRDAINKAGGFAFIVRSVEDAMQHLKTITE